MGGGDVGSSTALLGLCDCNNFFVSCERRRHPRLNGRPVVVLSNNDGCVVARSNEAKALGIAMGEPFFKVRSLCRQGLVALSGDLSFYGQVSSEVMACVEAASDAVERYSIDESFFNLSIGTVRSPVEYCRRLRDRIWRETRVPVAIGVAPTKTLAKAASERAKRTGQAVWRVEGAGLEAFLAPLPVGEVWGVGRKTNEKLRRQGIVTALDLARADPFELKKRFSVTLAQTSFELQGRRQWGLVTSPPPPKSLRVSRTEPGVLREGGALWDALRRHVVEGAARLRHQGCLTERVSVFLRTSWFDRRPKMLEGACRLSRPTNFEPALVQAARLIFDRIFRFGWDYRVTGVTFGHLSPWSARQLTFDDLDPKQVRRRRLEDWCTAMTRAGLTRR